LAVPAEDLGGSRSKGLFAGLEVREDVPEIL
jgi:hypothetical protein